MSTANLNFGDIEVKQSAIHKSKYPISIGKVDVKKHWDPTKFYRVKEVLALLGLENLRAGGGRASRPVVKKTCCISEHFCPFYMKFCTYTVLTIWNKSW